jgi:hypothetical protein
MKIVIDINDANSEICGQCMYKEVNAYCEGVITGYKCSIFNQELEFGTGKLGVNRLAICMASKLPSVCERTCVNSGTYIPVYGADDE